jgi:hypothetical protein
MTKLFAVLAATFTVALSSPVFATPCEDDLAKIDAALKSQDLAADVRAQSEDMRKQVDDLCKAGNEEDGLNVASELKALLAIE